MKNQQLNIQSRWFRSILPTMAMTILNSTIFAQSNPNCLIRRNPLDIVKLEELAQEISKSSGDLKNAEGSYIEKLRKLSVLISSKREAAKKIRAQLDLDEIALKTVDQQIRNELAATLGDQKATEILDQWNQDVTDAERSKILKEFSGSDSYRVLMESLATKKGLDADNRKKVKDVSFEFATVNPGEFIMGSPDGKTEADGIVAPEETGRDGDEFPRKVKITEPFEMAKTDVTQLQYFLIMESTPSQLMDENAGDYMEVSGKKINANRPVESVSWNDAQEFIQKINEQDSIYNYRLPTEAEWEYAARGGTSTAYSFGNNVADLPEYAIYRANSTSQVASKKPNPLGLYDMHGNVFQWCSDGYCKTPNGNENPRGDDSSWYRVKRGGAWNTHLSTSLRSANRYSQRPEDRDKSLGFRLVRTLK